MQEVIRDVYFMPSEGLYQISLRISTLLDARFRSPDCQFASPCTLASWTAASTSHIRTLLKHFDNAYIFKQPAAGSSQGFQTNFSLNVRTSPSVSTLQQQVQSHSTSITVTTVTYQFQSPPSIINFNHNSRKPPSLSSTAAYLTKCRTRKAPAQSTST